MSDVKAGSKGQIGAGVDQNFILFTPDGRSIPVNFDSIKINGKRVVSHVHENGADPSGLSFGIKEPSGTISMIKESRDILCNLAGVDFLTDLGICSGIYFTGGVDAPRTVSNAVKIDGLAFENDDFGGAVTDDSIKNEVAFKAVKIKRGN